MNNIDWVHQVGKSLAEVIVKAGMAKSKTKARRLIQEGAIRLNDRKIQDQHARLCIFEDMYACLQIIDGQVDIILLAQRSNGEMVDAPS